MSIIIKKEAIWFCYCNPRGAHYPIQGTGHCTFCLAPKWNKLPDNVILGPWGRKK